MSTLRASVRWKRVPASPLVTAPPKRGGFSLRAVGSVTERPCDGCGHMPISPSFPHAVFDASAEDLVKAKREVAA